jgi:hypothetical protein
MSEYKGSLDRTVVVWTRTGKYEWTLYSGDHVVCGPRRFTNDLEANEFLTSFMSNWPSWEIQYVDQTVNAPV